MLLQAYKCKEGCFLKTLKHPLSFSIQNNNDLELAKWVYDQGYWDTAAMYSAICMQNMDIIKWLYDIQNFSFTVSDLFTAYTIGNMEVIMFFRTKEPVRSEYDVYIYNNWPIMHIPKIKYSQESLEWLKKEQSVGVLDIVEVCPDTTDQDFLKMDFATLSLCRKNQSEFVKNSTKFYTLNQAIKHGDLDCIKWLRSKGNVWPEDAYGFFNIKRRDLNMLDTFKYMYENGCPWDPSNFFHFLTMSEEILTYLIENNVPYVNKDNDLLDVIEYYQIEDYYKNSKVLSNFLDTLRQ